LCSPKVLSIKLVEGNIDATKGLANFNSQKTVGVKDVYNGSDLIPNGQTKSYSVAGVGDGHKYLYMYLKLEGSKLLSAGSTTDGGSSAGSSGIGAASGNEQVLLSDTSGGWTYDPTRQMVVPYEQAQVKTNWYPTKQQAEAAAGIDERSGEGPSGSTDSINLDTGNFGPRAQGIFINDITINSTALVGYRPKVNKTQSTSSKTVPVYLKCKVGKRKNGLNVNNTPITNETLTSANFYGNENVFIKELYYRDSDKSKKQFNYTSDSPNKIKAGDSISLKTVANLKIDGTADKWGTVRLDLSKAVVSYDQEDTSGTEPYIDNVAVGLAGSTPSITSPYINHVTFSDDISESNRSIYFYIRF